jgi:hypothetical protein
MMIRKETNSPFYLVASCFKQPKNWSVCESPSSKNGSIVFLTSSEQIAAIDAIAFEELLFQQFPPLGLWLEHIYINIIYSLYQSISSIYVYYISTSIDLRLAYQATELVIFTGDALSKDEVVS